MLSSKKIKREEVDEQLLDTIFTLKSEWMNLKSIIERSFEPSEIGLYDLSVAEAKYFFLLREARHRKISALR
ncbi:YaaL family protein [Aquibacillus koreensis]|uniref:YaaL family protein n=1 Tax=Aquibacillus koreensis TaxID=279446 RepID=A0A9X3WS05_9BACI|nr:YaaL family protein [Aquibacillus koreensis]MCT2536981.1 YaaL family protein [Aquibacillus koreensis]MDC3422716.1 YaaL family protein [Aquibacillus koreensis]